MAHCNKDDNSYLVRYHNVWNEGLDLYIMMELCDCSLVKYQERVGLCQEETIIKIITEVGKCLIKLHKENIVHLNLKPDNIFLSFS